MQSSSYEYRQAMNAQLRPRSAVVVNIGIINQLAQEEAYVSSAYEIFPYVEQAFGNARFEAYYVTCEENYAREGMYFPPEDVSTMALYQGIVSKTVVNGSISISFDTVKSIKGLTIDFGEFYPEDFMIVAGGKTVNVIGNQSGMYITEETFDNIATITIKSMRYQLTMLDSLDVFTRLHSENVANLTCRICEYMHMKNYFTVYCTICAYLHDIGKQFIPPAVLQKNGKLTEEEYEIIKSHTTIGYQMCMRDEKLRPYMAGPLYHHEALNGSGYPNKKAAPEIPSLQSHFYSPLPSEYSKTAPPPKTWNRLFLPHYKQYHYNYYKYIFYTDCNRFPYTQYRLPVTV